ncbi:NADP oxidoreductase [Lamprobacter modestohalophilus]|uniref:NADH-quinone oxidoreductase subunit B family protein n=1 Tax=Lamprobacter modestohalophilus TaxID=1064514 RepID=UPI002ADECCC5|nr:NADP oxidoreductase [Lamprobacter modestohalophilus]MEA1049293.1 NADP oxidoreductase [Lamprobacter modestohalophilus]
MSAQPEATAARSQAGQPTPDTEAPLGTATNSSGNKVTVATIWLDGCSGCHMSFLDMDERLVELAQKIDIVYSPLVDCKTLPEQVDVGIIEGSISNEEDLHKAKLFRERCKLLVSLGDCAVNGNVPAMRNAFKLDNVYERAYLENVNIHPQIPTQGVPALLQTVLPVHAVVDVDVFIPGCPPQADTIHYVLSELLEGRVPEPLRMTRFGA